MGMNWFSLCWMSLKCTLFSIQVEYYNLQATASNVIYCGLKYNVHLTILSPMFFNVVFLPYSVVYHKQCKFLHRLVNSLIQACCLGLYFLLVINLSLSMWYFNTSAVPIIYVPNLCQRVA